MSRLFSLVARFPTILRTLRWIRPPQALAQAHHLLVGLPAPRHSSGAPPRQAVERARTDFLGPPAHVQVEFVDRIRLLEFDFRLDHPVDWTTTVHGPLFAYHLHQHDYLRAPVFLASERRERILDWIENHRAGIGWDPHPISLRLLCWGKLLLTEGALDLGEADRRALLASFADQAETLAQGLEIRLQANHLLSNLISVVWAGLLVEGGRSEAWRAHAARLEEELERQIHPDGGHEERSPMYHALLLENLLDLLNLCLGRPGGGSEKLVTALESAASRMLGALALWTHPDGRIALFADSAFDVASEPAVLADYADRLGIEAPGSLEPRELPVTGYARLENAEVVMIASVAGPAPAHQPGHAHCDALSFELSVRGRRLISDTGLYEYIPGERRDLARATASHSTISIDDEEQAEVWSAHRVGGRPIVCRLDGDPGCVVAACRGWSRRGTQHRRRFELEPAGLAIRDSIDGSGGRVVSRFHFDPAWRVELLDGHRARVTHAFAPASVPVDPAAGVGANPMGAGFSVQVELGRELAWRVGQSPFYPSFGRERQRHVLIGEGTAPLETQVRFRIVEG